VTYAAAQIDQLVGQVCVWGRSNIGSMISLDFGSPAEVPAAHGFFVDGGEWTMQRGDHAVATWQSPRTELVAAVDGIVGTTVQDVTVDEQTGSVRLTMSDGLSLDVQRCTYDDDAPWWSVYRAGQLVLDVGPGHEASSRSSGAGPDSL